ncbi:gliding motility lipoprotein GldH [Mucilaginibacter sp.]|uniref:gliding motility lipoprotein GldH n=1 Tax=Mucilaginibacter sp. TaxID=1882438 RepID=UPI0026151EC3|nr:gliding motility lipoprotein GldH [Mucilaginibacter sp.]MDB4923937.1 gliding motility lipoprotein GldH [Mucilaginibacter sp.]
MKKRLIYFYLALSAGLLLFAGCTDKNAVIDQNMEVPGHNWTYLNRFKFPVKIDEEKQAYNLYMNLRVTGDYKYSNLFVLISQTGPDKKTATKRYEMKLANKDGEWLGKGSGNLYSYQVPFVVKYTFPAKGTYTFTVEQNMRDNPLREVSDVGLRVEKVN